MLVCDRAVSMTITVKKRHKSAASNWKQQSDNLRAKLEAQDDRAQALTSQVMYMCAIRLRYAVQTTCGLRDTSYIFPSYKNFLTIIFTYKHSQPVYNLYTDSLSCSRPSFLSPLAMCADLVPGGLALQICRTNQASAVPSGGVDVRLGAE